MERIGLAPGSEVGGYRILSPLGSGGMGTVYRAVDGGGTAVALKLLHPHIGADPVARDRLRREAAALQRLRHPAVAAVLDAEADSTEAFIVTELIEGDTLEELVRARGPLEPDELADLAEGLTSALRAVHAAGVVHRDLKPSNIMMTAAGPVLIDFGIAQSADDSRVTSTGLVAGTPGYLPPELMDGADPSATSDWWGWAAVLAFAATGRPPFGVRPFEVVLARARAGEPDLDGLGPVATAALRAALSPRPADRRPADQVIAALRRAVLDPELDDPELDPQAGIATAVVGQWPPTAATEATRVLAPDPVPPPIFPPLPPFGAGGAVHDGSTRLLPTGTVGPPAERWGEGTSGGVDPDDAVDDGVDDEDAFDDGPAAPARRRGSVLALGVLVVTGAALFPVATLVVVAVTLVVFRTVGSSARALHRRRERVGARRTDPMRTVVAAPWHTVLGAVGVLPSVLVGASVAIIVAGGLRWWSTGPGTAGARWSVVLDGGGGTDVTVSVVLSVAMLCGIVSLWWGPSSDLTRTGARWTLGGLAPGRAGTRAMVLLALCGAALMVAGVLTGTAVDWWPMAEPALARR